MAAVATADETAQLVDVMRPEDLPKGERVLKEVNGEAILLFWYRNEVYCIEARSPAEGAYSEGFVKSRLTQEYGIECPTTGSVFSLKTGEVLYWYPSNPILAALTPRDTVRNLRIYPLKYTQDAIQVDASKLGNGNWYKGGADSSIDKNNVFSTEPRVYLEGTDPDAVTWGGAGAGGGGTGTGTKAGDAATILIGLLWVAVLAVGGTAFFVFYENYIGMGIFWAVLFAVVASYAYNNVLSKEDLDAVE